MKKLNILIAISIFTSYANAEIKQIVCDSSFGETVASYEKSLLAEEDSCKSGDGSACGKLERSRQFLEKCKSSDGIFGGRYIFKFDESALSGNSKSFAEYYSMSCSGGRSDVEKVNISSTPSKIVIEMPIPILKKSIFFNIDRETLEASGSGSSRVYKCKVNSIENKNKI